MRQQLMMHQQRARVPGPQQGMAGGPQQSLGPNMNAQTLQNNATQNFNILSDDITFDLG